MKPIGLKKGIGITVIWLLSALPALLYAEEVKAPADVRVLIDISGSMKKNDPENLRIPAVNLLTELVPDGDKAGIWTFGQYVNMLVKHRTVDDQWRADAKKKAREINSVALFTNIGGVLEKSADDFSRDQTFENTHFILLTDGMVDIDPSPDVNAIERQRIMTEILGGFEDKGAKVHTIALSANADLPLMERLAVSTGGFSTVAENSDDLTKAFLQALNQAAPKEEVPLEGNRFAIDSSIEEFTALVFRKPESQSTVLVQPDGTKFGIESYPDTVRWYRDKGYDLITVQRPLEGEWILEAELEPDSRVTVISNLRMDVTKLPANFYVGDHLKVDVSFFDEGNIITDRDFLSVLDVDLNIKMEDGRSGTKRISDPSMPPEDGVFNESIRKLRQEGQYEVNVLVDGKTFKRKHRQIVTLRSPLDIELAANGFGDQTSYELVIRPQSPEVDSAGTSIVTKITAPDASSTIKTVPFVEAEQGWRLPIDASRGDGTYTVALKVKGKNKSGNAFKFSPRTFEANFPRQPSDGSNYVSLSKEPEPAVPGAPPLAEEAPAVEPEPAPEPEPQAEPEPEVADEPAIAPPIQIPETMEQDMSVTEAPVEEESDNLMLYSIIGAGVAGTLLLGGIGFWLIRRKKAKAAEDIKEPEPEFIEEVQEEPVDEVEEAIEEVPIEEPEAPVSESEPEEVEESEVPDLEEPEAPVAEEAQIMVEESVSDAAVEAEKTAEPVDEVTEAVEVAEEIPEMQPADQEPDLTAEISDVLEDAAEQIQEEIDAAEAEEVLTDGLDAEALADQILEENAAPEDEEFNLEDFDISDTDDLPAEADDKADSVEDDTDGDKDKENKKE